MGMSTSLLRDRITRNVYYPFLVHEGARELIFHIDHKVLGIPAGLQFNLLNSTAFGGNRLDCLVRYQVVAAEWLKGKPDEYPAAPWVGYLYRWGLEGTSISMATRTLGDFIKAALGVDAEPLADSWVVLRASELLHIFVKANINGIDVPASHGEWNGNFSIENA